MNATSTSFYSAALTLCLFSAGIVGSRRSRSGRPFTFFTGFLALEAFAFGCELLMVHPAAPLKGLFLGLRLASSLMLAPCLWLGLREIVDGTRPPCSSLGRRHLWAIVAGAAMTLPLIATAHLGSEYANPERPTAPLHARVIHAGMLACVAVFAVQVPIFLQRCRRLLSDAGAHRIGWLHLPLLVVSATWLLGIVRTLHCAFMSGEEKLVAIFAAAEVSVVVTAIFLMARGVARGPRQVITAEPLALAPSSGGGGVGALPRAGVSALRAAARWLLPPRAAPSPTLPGQMDKSATGSKYVRSRVNAATRARIKRKLEAALGEESVCTDSLLSLRALCRVMHENAHHVSQVINQDLGSSFYDLISRYRIERAKTMLHAAPDRGVLEIALAVGFNSKSTFNAAFRRVTGQTPRQFRATRHPPRA